MRNFLIGCLVGGILTAAGVIGVQWVGIEYAKDTIGDRVQQECKRQVLKRTQCMQKHSQRECSQMVLDFCGPQSWN